jgi:hypothetical protein
MAEASRIRGLFEASRYFTRVYFVESTSFSVRITYKYSRNAPDGPALLKAGTIHLSQSVFFQLSCFPSVSVL